MPRLHSAQALVQRCLDDDDVSRIGDLGGPLVGGFGPSYTVQQVTAGNGLG